MTLDRGWGRLGSRAFELMNALHVIEEVVAAWKAVAGYSTLTVLEVAEMRPGAMTMHTMRFALVTEQAGGRRELNANARLLVAAERL